jgi:hypothetical protein
MVLFRRDSLSIRAETTSARRPLFSVGDIDTIEPTGNGNATGVPLPSACAR